MSRTLSPHVTLGVIAVGLAFVVPPHGAAVARAAAAQVAPLTLEAALRFTREANRTVEAARIAVRAAANRSRDAEHRPNPELSASAENFGSTRGGDILETSLALSQTFELGGDRSARAGAAASDVAIARGDAARAALEQAAITAERFFAAWSLQQRVSLLRVAGDQAREAVATAVERHRAGAAPEFERVRAETYLATRELERRRAEAGLAVAKRRLALQWNGSQEDVDSMSLAAPDSVAAERTGGPGVALSGHPDRARAEAAARAGEWRVRVARSARTPDVTLGLGIRRLAESAATGFTFEISVPLPLWNGGAGSVTAAEADRDAARIVTASVEAALTEQLLAAQDEWRAAWTAYQVARDVIGPGAEEALRLMRGGYRAGRLSYLDILEGQRSVLEANQLVVDTHAEVWRAQMNLDLLTGGPLAPKEER